MKKAINLMAILLALPVTAHAHFLVLKPSTDILEGKERSVTLEAKFTHPIEGEPNMDFEIANSGAVINGKRLKLSWKRVEIPAVKGSSKKVSSFKAEFRIRRPGVYQFYVDPKPYFEPTEGKFIKQITKVYVEAFGLEEGWDRPIGLKAEIVPLTKPFGIWEGNTFRGRVFINGKPAANVNVEVEYLNPGNVKVPADAFVPQVVKTDENGYFVYTIPWAGWWGFSAIGDGGKLRHEDGKLYPVELDAVIWVKAYPKPKGVR